MIGSSVRIESIDEIPGCSTTTSNTIESWYYSAPVDLYVNTIGYYRTGELLENDKLKKKRKR